MSKGARIVVFTGRLNYSVLKGISDINEELSGCQWLIMLHCPNKSPSQLIHNQWRNIKRNGWRWIPYQLGDIWERLRFRAVSVKFDLSIGREFTLPAILAWPHLRLLRCSDIHAPDAVAELKAFGADLGLSLAAPILKRTVFDLPRLGTINLHKGKLPDFRGMPPAFWELWNNQNEVGCSVHWVNDQLDTGDLVCETTVPRERFSTVRGLQLRLDEIGCDLMCRAVKDVLAGRAPALQQPVGKGSTNRKPTLLQEAQLSHQLSLLSPVQGGVFRRAFKETYHSIGYQVGRLALRTVLAPRVTVLLYHRVTDEARDNLTVGIEQFDRQMTLLTRYCRVVSIEEVLDSRHVVRSDKPMIAITFDDGYLDNFTYAAPILRRHGLPAAFFVSTGIIDRQGRFPHDLRRGNSTIPTISWEQLRRMREWGFYIGSHTVNHIDCAAEPEDVVRDELTRSRDDIERELGVKGVVLGYPYGGRQHMTPARLQIVKQLGYSGCLSAYGGSNVGIVDRFNVLRRGIHWEFSDRAFLFETLGLG